MISTKNSRKKFLWISSLFVAAGAGLRLLPLYKNKKNVQGQTSKLLTQDGNLVEIDSRLITGSGKKISNTDLQNWISKEKINKPHNGQH